MQLKKLVWHIFPANLAVTLCSLLAILWYSSTALDQFHSKWTETALQNRAYLIEEQIALLVAKDRKKELNTFCRRIGRKSSTRITVINPSGTVIADSDENPEKLGDHSNRPEIKSAISGKIGTNLRFSSSLGVKMLYVAIPLPGPSAADKNEKFHVLRVSMPASAIEQTLRDLRVKVAISGIIVALLAMLAAIIISKRISKPLEEMTRRAEQFARENFSSPLAVTSDCSLEVGTLVNAMNSMAFKLQERIDTIVNQRNELQTILASMAEAIMVIDNDKHVTTINASACRLLKIPAEKAIGRSTQAILRNIDIERLVDTTLAGPEAVAEEISMVKGAKKIFLQYSGVRLLDSNGHQFGAVVVLNDVTHIRRLENVRREFVANVSHELMTPLTSIKGYTETILDTDPNDREQTRKFLEIILRQSNRLQAIVNDLLELSRIEKEIEYNEIHPVPTRVRSILDEALQVCSLKAAEKEMTIRLNCPTELMAPMDGQLMEQAIVNLLVNAIKYSNPSSKVEIRVGLRTAKNHGEMVEISVQDYGVGIGQEHLPFLFDRFYRSDKDRSRKLGGTGLGLAIVKHIVQAHQGRVEVESEVGHGSVFTIFIPATQLPG
ncbi:MAG: cell wall metabolism sensor histidine kinase WalK [Proteobacteria bacterium]|nr:cell wall metabolism sensor histidine kinase WalK [Pseudomonadota bacterium]MBU1714246.1 cell wall metabolism sensor histidine kinase WalK [Pseudomonadota bacterium]